MSVCVCFFLCVRLGFFLKKEYNRIQFYIGPRSGASVGLDLIGFYFFGGISGERGKEKRTMGFGNFERVGGEFDCKKKQKRRTRKRNKGARTFGDWFFFSWGLLKDCWGERKHGVCQDSFRLVVLRRTKRKSFFFNIYFVGVYMMVCIHKAIWLERKNGRKGEKSE